MIGGEKLYLRIAPHFPTIFDKFLDTFFTPGMSIKVRNLNIFQPMFASRPFLKIFATRLTKKILDVLATNLKVDQLIDASEEKFSVANEYLYKISLFYSTKIPVQNLGNPKFQHFKKQLEPRVSSNYHQMLNNSCKTS